MLSLVNGTRRGRSFRPKVVDDELRRARRANFTWWDSKDRSYEDVITPSLFPSELIRCSQSPDQPDTLV